MHVNQERHAMSERDSVPLREELRHVWALTGNAQGLIADEDMRAA
jgi:hypothetical protein